MVCSFVGLALFTHNKRYDESVARRVRRLAEAKEWARANIRGLGGAGSAQGGSLNAANEDHSLLSPLDGSSMGRIAEDESDDF